MRVFYTDIFVLPLPEKHKFPMDKYRLTRERLLESNVLKADQLAIPPAAYESLALVHDEDYLEQVREGKIDPRMQRRIGFPWSEGLVERSRRSVGATIAALESAFIHGCGINLAGGTHHAYADRGEGFCVFNDAAVASRTIQMKRELTNILILDCDVHQGNGTAAIFQNDPTVFTFSIHGASNYPYHKEKSDLDIALPNATEDATYLDALAQALQDIDKAFKPEAVIYLAGADPYKHDRFGKLALSKDGLRNRDAMVFKWCKAKNLPVAVTMAGGYAEDIDDIVDIHCETVKQAKLHYC